MAKRVMTRDQVLEIASLKKQMMTNRALAARYGVSLTTINYWTKRLKREGHSWDRVRSGGMKKMDLSE